MTKIPNSKQRSMTECTDWPVSVVGILNLLFACPVKQIEDLMQSIVEQGKEFGACFLVLCHQIGSQLER